jgi:hypothetical protein
MKILSATSCECAEPPKDAIVNASNALHAKLLTFSPSQLN